MTIELQNICKAFPGGFAISNLNMTVASERFTTFLGPSGCGKTTILRMIAGLETPDSGTILIDGRKVFCDKEGINVSPNKRGLSFVFQDFALWPHMTVYENVAFPLRAGKDTDDLDTRVREALAAVQLAGMESRYPGQLSGGQQQRVAFARAIVGRPGCILFDEPLSALDAILREQMREELRELVASSLTCPPNVMTVSTDIVSEFNQGSVANGMCMAVICVVITTTLLIALNTISGKDKS